MNTAIYYSLIPFFTFSLGGLLATLRKPSETWHAVIQHFAAGVVFAVVAVDLLPDIVKSQDVDDVLIGFSAGVVVMLLIRHLAERAEAVENSPDHANLPYAILGAVAIDVLVDGFLIGVLCATNEQAGEFLTIALGLEMFSLGLALSTSLRQSSIGSLFRLGIVVFLASMVVASAFMSYHLIHVIPSGGIPVLLSFGLAALLYLVTEELLHEAHQLPDNALITATFFIGFLMFLVLAMLH